MILNRLSKREEVKKKTSVKVKLNVICIELKKICFFINIDIEKKDDKTRVKVKSPGDHHCLKQFTVFF